jgi:hypothetical protein
MKDVKPEIRERALENGKESPGSLLKFTERFLLETAKYILRMIAKEQVMGIELNIEEK